MLKKIGIVLIVVVVGLAVVIAMRPSHFSIERSATIHAPADVVYGFVSDLHQFKQWSPWDKLDPAMTTTFDGPAVGVGQSYSWKGNSKVGEGKMMVKELKPNESVAMDLDFLAPFKAHNLSEFKLKPAGDGVTVTWVMTGENDFMGKAFGLFGDMDKMVGGDFEKGLAQLSAVSEAEAKKRVEQAKAAEAAKAAAAAAAPPAPAAPVKTAAAPAPKAKPKH